MSSMRKDPPVSIVTPFHNTGKYLGECIRSVLNQTHSDFEYILQDNASTDGASEIAEEFASKDSRIRLIRTESLLPQIPNYNRALTHIDAGSRYCKIVQADDWIFPECIARMVDLAERNPRVGLVSSLRLDGEVVKGDGLPYQAQVIDGKEICRLQLLRRGFFFGSPTTVLFRSEIVRGRRPFFEENRFQEDTEVCFDIMKEWDFGYVHQVLSYSRVEPDSIFSRLARFDNAALGRMLLTHRYGRHFLSHAEFESIWRSTLAVYYGRLANSILERRAGGDYWAFHKRELASENLSLEYGRLTGSLVRELLDILGNPKKSLGRLVRHLRAK